MRNTRALALRRLHKARISQDSIDLILQRSTKTPDGAGGFVMDDRKLPAQTVRVVPLRQGPGKSEIQTDQARLVKEDWVLMGFPELSVELHDRFTYQGDQWKVTSILERSPQRVMAGVVRLGPADNAD